MVTFTELERVENKAQVQKALIGYLNKEYSIPRKAANAFKIACTTLLYRTQTDGRTHFAFETQQTLSNVEETSLTGWLTRLTGTGFPAAPNLVMEMAEELRRGRVQLSTHLFQHSTDRLFLA